MIVGGEEGAGFVDFVQMLDRCPGNRQAIESGGSPADFIENDQRPVSGLVENCGRFDHLHHEGRSSAGQVVSSTDTGEQPVDDADMGACRRNETTHLCQHGNQGVLPEKG